MPPDSSSRCRRCRYLISPLPLHCQRCCKSLNCYYYPFQFAILLSQRLASKVQQNLLPCLH
uniref:Uncharacterized protein n=1 Tax=uncultured marine virus TaxID=186617 RepID=A0A0F7L8K8_9VIRU|nr:hypothetical protein [uncultured marine virus]